MGSMSMNKKFQVEKRGKLSWVLIRQMPHDPQYKMGSHIPSYGKVVAIEPEVYCVECGAETELDCICDDLNFADGSCNCGIHNEI